MSFDPENILLTPNAWFSDQITYAGRGRAEFLDPLGVVEGQAHVRFGEYGKPSIELDVERFESAQPLQMGLMQLISGQKPIIVNGGVGISGGGEPPNLCTKLSVTTPQGEFSATEGIHYDYSFYIGTDRQAKLTFSALRSQFDVVGDSPQYWVLPLTNFLSRFVAHHPTLDRHPLRIYPTPVVPDGLTGDDAFIAAHNANLKNRLITFEFKGSPGFIEPLADYDVREKSLLEGCKRLAVTAVMVSEVGSESIDQADLKDWFPDDFLRLLSLATGTQVGGAPWIEFRDGDGKLLRRIHVQLNQTQFSKGRQPMEEGVHSGIGYLLTKYQASPERGKSYLTVAIKHLSHAARSGQSMEDKFIYLVRALDNLCEHYRFSTQYLMQNLEAQWQQAVGQILDSAAQQIRAEARAAARGGQFDQSRTLEAIAGRATQTPVGKDRKFGLAVADLLKHFSLPDADIIDAYYQANPRPDGIQT